MAGSADQRTVRTADRNLHTPRQLVAGIKVMDDSVLAVLTDLAGNVVTDAWIPLHDHATDAVLGRCVTAINALLDSSSICRTSLIGLGVCLPGTVEWSTGICRRSPYLGWHDVPVAQLLGNQLGVPVSVDNDVNALATAESLFGCRRGARNFAVITLGRGVGSALVYDHAVYRGGRGGAGELGHMICEPGGRPCECGKTGCLEAYVGETALLRRADELGIGGKPPTINALLTLARDGDNLATQLYDELSARLSVSIANLINLVDPELVLLSGDAGYLTDRFVAELRPRVLAHIFNGIASSVRIEIDVRRSDRTAWSRGAAGLALERLTKTPGASFAAYTRD
jgi:predicted NBD/HSP70 family sugar kinase